MLRIVVFAALYLIFMISSAAAQTTDSLRALLIEYRCPVVDRLERIYEAGDHASHQDRFLAVTVAGHPHGYVQCIFFGNRTKLLCEAASGYFFDPPGKPRSLWLRRDAIAALARLGFSSDDSEGNFRLERGLAKRPDFNAIADLILKTLHDGYGARAETPLRFNAPFAPRAGTSCIPLG